MSWLEPHFPSTVCVFLYLLFSINCTNNQDIIFPKSSQISLLRVKGEKKDFFSNMLILFNDIKDSSQAFIVKY